MSSFSNLVLMKFDSKECRRGMLGLSHLWSGRGCGNRLKIYKTTSKKEKKNQLNQIKLVLLYSQ